MVDAAPMVARLCDGAADEGLDKEEGPARSRSPSTGGLLGAIAIGVLRRGQKEIDLRFEILVDRREAGATIR